MFTAPVFRIRVRRAAAKSAGALQDDGHPSPCAMIFCGGKQAGWARAYVPPMTALGRADLLDEIGDDNPFGTVNEALDAAGAHVAQEGVAEPAVSGRGVVILRERTTCNPQSLNRLRATEGPSVGCRGAGFTSRKPATRLAHKLLRSAPKSCVSADYTAAPPSQRSPDG